MVFEPNGVLSISVIKGRGHLDGFFRVRSILHRVGGDVEPNVGHDLPVKSAAELQTWPLTWDLPPGGIRLVIHTCKYGKHKSVLSVPKT